jgi:tetratricopeptide (TPR) repeat protein
MVREALLFDRQGRMPEAIAAYQRVLARCAALPDCWYRLALLQRKTRDFSGELASYQQPLDQGVRKPEEVHLNRGVIYTDDLRQYDAAERELLTALTLNPSYVPALLNLADLAKLVALTTARCRASNVRDHSFRQPANRAPTSEALHAAGRNPGSPWSSARVRKIIGSRRANTPG